MVPSLPRQQTETPLVVWAAATALTARRQVRARQEQRMMRSGVLQPEVLTTQDVKEVPRGTLPKRPLLGPAVVITGASEGVGRATAKQFAVAGYHIMVAARTPETLEVAAEATKPFLKPGRQVITVTCDITSEADVASLQVAAAEHFKEVRAVVCNAGVCMSGDFLEHDMKDFESQMQVNFLGHVATAQAFLPGLLEIAATERGKRQHQKPTLCFVNSFGARVPLPNFTAYCASKYALQGFADSLRLEAEPQGVRVITVHPGVIRSDFRKRAQFRGPKGEAGRANLDSILDGSSFLSRAVTQNVDEVAEAVLKAVQGEAAETVVGSAFKAVIGAHGIAKALGAV